MRRLARARQGGAASGGIPVVRLSRHMLAPVLLLGAFACTHDYDRFDLTEQGSSGGNAGTSNTGGSGGSNGSAGSDASSGAAGGSGGRSGSGGSTAGTGGSTAGRAGNGLQSRRSAVWRFG